MSVSVCAGWKYCSITISPLARSSLLLLKFCCGKASAGGCQKVQTQKRAVSTVARGVQIGVIVSAVDRPERVDHRFQRCIAEPIYIFFQLRPNRQKKRLQQTSAFRMRIRLSGLSKMTPSFLQKQITRRGITRNRSRKAHLTFFCPYSMERRYVRSLPPSLEAEAYICLYTYMLF